MTSALVRSSSAHPHPNIVQAVQYGRAGVSIASALSSLGFLTARNGTKLGFSIACGLTTSAVSLTSTFTERTIFGTDLGSDKFINYTISKSFDVVQALTLVPIYIGQAATEASIVVASASLESLSRILDIPSHPTDYQLSLSYGYPSDTTSPQALAQLSGPFSTTAMSFTHAIPSLVQILKHEWQNPQDAHQLPAESYSALSIARAIVAWASIQNVTRLHHETKWFSAMREIHHWEWQGQPNPRDSPSIRSFASSTKTRSDEKPRKRKSSVHITSGVHLPHHGGEIFSAEIGEPTSLQKGHSRRSSIRSTISSKSPENPGYPAIRQALRRYSRLVLGGYGGAGVVFFGVQLPSSINGGLESGAVPARGDDDGPNLGYTPLVGGLSPKPHGLSPAHLIDTSLLENRGWDHVPSSGSPEDYDETKTLTEIVLEAEELDDDDDWDLLEPPSPNHLEDHMNPSRGNPERPATYSWWNLLLGRHDQEIFEAFATHGSATPRHPSTSLPLLGEEQDSSNHLPPMVHAGEAERLPRFWVLTDHRRQQIVLVLRGTMTLNEVAIDLACAAVPFSPAQESHPVHSASSLNPETIADHRVHEGMYELARFMGDPGKPVHKVIASALESNEDYELVLCGHSLGAGVCAVLGLMWADPTTCLTVQSSGLPEGRRVSVFGFAPPCVMSPSLSKLASPLVTSIAYSNDVITRLSLGAVRDLKRATSWLCYGQNSDEQGESCSNIISRALVLEKGFGFIKLNRKREEEEAWFLSLRKTLEANMTKADLFPPGRVIWALRDNDLHPSLQAVTASSSLGLPRLFEVHNVEQVFGQVIFSRDMISSHFVQNYDRILQQYL